MDSKFLLRKSFVQRVARPFFRSLFLRDVWIRTQIDAVTARYVISLYTQQLQTLSSWNQGLASTIFWDERIKSWSGKSTEFFGAYWARICKRLKSPVIDSGNRSASLCSQAGRYVTWGCRTGPSGWESIPGLLERFTNTGSVECRVQVLYFTAI